MSKPNTYTEIGLRVIEKRLERGKYVSAEDLADALKKSRAISDIPPIVFNHICDHLEGAVRKPRGRKSKKRDAETRIRNELALVYYEKYLPWLQKRKKSVGLKGWGCIREAPWWKGPPNERATHMTLRRLGKLARNIDYKHLKDIISSVKKGTI